MLQVGIVGLPNVGKSTLFNALTAAGAPAENYPFCTVEPNVGIVSVPDSRLPVIRELAGSMEAVPALIRFVDIAGLVRGASRGEGLGNQFLGHIREVDAIAHVLRCFGGSDVTHVMGSVDPARDAAIVQTEMILADLEVIQRRSEKVEKQARSGDAEAQREMVLLGRIQEALSRGLTASSLDFSAGERTLAEDLQLLTLKPVLYVANVPEGEPPRSIVAEMQELERSLASEGVSGPVVSVSAALEAEVALLEPGERQLFLDELGAEEAGLPRVIRAAYDLLDLLTFFSANEKQTHAWTVPRGTRAPEAAGVIHSDFQRGFIRAEAIGFEEFVRAGSMKVARDRGVIRTEGKDYVVEDGDILFFRFKT